MPDRNESEERPSDRLDPEEIFRGSNVQPLHLESRNWPVARASGVLSLETARIEGDRGCWLCDRDLAASAVVAFVVLQILTGAHAGYPVRMVAIPLNGPSQADVECSPRDPVGLRLDLCG